MARTLTWTLTLTMTLPLTLGDTGDFLKHADGSDLKVGDGKTLTHTFAHTFAHTFTPILTLILTSGKTVLSAANERCLSEDGNKITITITRDWDDDGKKKHTVAKQTYERQSS